MQVKVAESGPCRKLVEIRAEPNEVRSDYDEVLSMYMSYGQVPGFRPGKAPQKVVEKRFAKRILDDARDQAVPRIYREALESKGIQPVAIVDVQDLAFTQEAGLTFNVLVDVPPDFKVPKYKKIPVKAVAVNVTEEQVEDAIKRIRERFASFNDVEDRALQADDLAQVDFEATIDGVPLKEIAPKDTALGSSKDFYVVLGEPEFLPGFIDGLNGAAIGETREITVAFPDDYRVKEVAGMTALYQVAVKGIRQRVLPDMDEEFFKTIGVEDEPTLRDRIRTDLTTQMEREEKQRQASEITKFLIEKTKMDIPQSVLDDERRLLLRNMVNEFSRSGGTPEQMEQNRDQIWKMATETSEERVKTGYILSRIGEAESIEATDEEVDTRIVALAQQYGMTPEEFKKALDERNGRESVRSDIRNEKTLEFLLSEAKVK